MSNESYPIILDLAHGSTVEYKLLKTNDKGTSIVTNGRIHLAKGKLYYLPILDKTLSLDDHYIIKPVGKVNEIIDIRNVENGYVAVLPIANNVILRDGTLLGNVI